MARGPQGEETARALARETGDESIPFPALKQRRHLNGVFFVFILKLDEDPRRGCD